MMPIFEEQLRRDKMIHRGPQNEDLAEYLTTCLDKNDHRVMYEHIYEARSAEEATEKAINGCIKKGAERASITIRADRIVFY